MYGELERYSLYINRFVRIIKYWGKIIQSDNVLIQFLYNELFIACNNGVKYWSYNVKQLLDNYGFSHVFRDPHLKNHSTFYLEFKSRVIDINLYRYFKTCFEQEQYLNELLPKYRVALSKLRLASNKLKIVTVDMLLIE